MNLIKSVVLICATFTLSEARQCYVCGLGADEPFKSARQQQQQQQQNRNYNTSSSVIDQHHPLSCDEFGRSSSLEKFVRDCPEDFIGCITQVEGFEVTRTCDTLPINDCQTANGIQYCYCNTDLCNDKSASPKNSHHRRTTFLPVTDDEDLFEASGMLEVTNDDIHESELWTALKIKESVVTTTEATQGEEVITTTTWQTPHKSSATNVASRIKHLLLSSFWAIAAVILPAIIIN